MTKLNNHFKPKSIFCPQKKFGQEATEKRNLLKFVAQNAKIEWFLITFNCVSAIFAQIPANIRVNTIKKYVIIKKLKTQNILLRYGGGYRVIYSH